MKSLQKEQNSKNLLLWPPICRNKPAITPKWFNSLDTNSRNYPSWIHWQDIDPPELKLHDALHSASIEYSAQIILWWFSQLSLPKGSNVTFNIRSTFVSEFFEDAMACNCKTTGDKIVPTTSLRLRYKIVLSGVSWKTWLESIWLVVLLMFEL